MNRLHPKSAARKSRRVKVFEPGSMTCGPGERRIHILDISPGGAQAYCSQPPELSDRIAVRCGPIAAEGQVCWVSGRSFGIRFSEPVDPALIEELSASSAGACMSTTPEKGSQAA